MAHRGEEVALGLIRPLRLFLGETDKLLHDFALAYVFADQDDMAYQARRRAHRRCLESGPCPVASGGFRDPHFNVGIEAFDDE